MLLNLYNSLTKKTEPFTKELFEEVFMYNCGPTVYDVQHIGNLSSFVFADTIRKVLEYNGYRVRQVINITDIGHLIGDNQGDPNIGDDKMMKGLRENNLPVSLEGLKILAEKYTSIFLEDIGALGIPVEDILFPRASEYIEEQITMIQKLEERGHVYMIEDGVYFDIATFSTYGELGGVGKALATNKKARVISNSEKHNSEDFALWKLNSEYGWESPWGKGFPGWHIECSAMATALLGPTLDIHTGGIEHENIHHNNEIAQSECANHIHPFSRFWLHRNHVQLDGGKISKSSGDVVYLSDIVRKGYLPSDLRYFFLQAQYNSPSNFTWEGLRASSVARKKLAAFISQPKTGEVIIKYREQFIQAVNDNLNTPKALSVVWIMIGDEEYTKEDKKATILDFNRVFGLDLLHPLAKEGSFPSNDVIFMEERKAARNGKKWIKSDEIRDVLAEKGYLINDAKDVSTYERDGRKMLF